MPLPIAAMLGFFGKRDFIYLAIIAGLLIFGYIQKAHYKSEIADLTVKAANLATELSETQRRYEVEKGNYEQCKAGMSGLTKWIDEYKKGCAESRSTCEAQLRDCINAKPPVTVGKDGVKGVAYEDGKTSDSRVADRIRKRMPSQ